MRASPPPAGPHHPFATAGTPTVAFEHLPGLDGLRGIAILLVIWHHAPHIFAPGNAIYDGWFWRASASGWLGVDLFFVVSGFLITSILLRTRERHDQLRVFWIRRALRILPLAYLYLFVLMGAAFSGADLDELKNPRVAFMYFFYLANLRIAAGGWPAGELAILWSLAIEEQFYAAWPLAVQRLSVSALLWVCGGLILSAPFVRWWVFDSHGSVATFVFTFCRVDALAAGAALAVLAQGRFRAPALAACRALAAPAVLVLVALCALPFGPSYPGHAPRLLSVLGYSLVAIAFACLVGVAVQPGRWARRVVTSRVLMWFGQRCYGLYLWHYIVGSTLYRMLGPASPRPLGYYGSVAVWLAATMLVATLSWSLFEAPILRLKRRFAA